MTLIKYFYWDMASRWKREEYIAAFLRNIPGHVGADLRRRWYSMKFGKTGRNLTIYPGAMILNPFKVECGDNVNIGFYNYLQAGGGIRLGNNTLLGPYAKIWSQTHKYQDPLTPVNEQGSAFKTVFIGDDVWIGANVFIMPGTVIGNRCIISANSVVGQKEYPEGTILAGYPARKIGERSE
jgi:acetyltransferase-like isoleucine patch superfamily enzyme